MPRLQGACALFAFQCICHCIEHRAGHDRATAELQGTGKNKKNGNVFERYKCAL